MAEPFLAEIRIFSFGFPPKGWALCDGQLLPINQNQALFSLLGTTYGGDGRVNFGLPNLQGRIPFHMGGGMTLGQMGGEEIHTLNSEELATHVHTFALKADPGTTSLTTNPDGNVMAPVMLGAGILNAYSTQFPDVHSPLANTTPVGGSQPHPNLAPFLTLNFSIALQGIFPSQT